MRKIVFTILIALVTLTVVAQSTDSNNVLKSLDKNSKMLNILFDSRIDLHSTFNNDGDLDYLSFRAQMIRVWAEGEIVPGIRYRARQKLNRLQTPHRDGFSSATDNAWLAFDLNKSWTITIGKQNILHGTFEYDYASTELYLKTLCFETMEMYEAGVNAAYRFWGQELNLQVVNSNNPQYASAEYANRALGVNFLWKGNLFDGMIKTLWGYGAFQHDDKKFYSWITPGTQLSLGKFLMQADYYFGYRDVDYSEEVNDILLGRRYVRDQSVSLNFRYDFGIWKAMAKGVWNQRHDMNYQSVAYESWGAQVALEFYPFKSPLLKDFRFHVAYYYNETNFKNTFRDLKSVGEHTFLVGIKWFFKAK